jgi:glycosyltransferase involved in cell wall biosynthesis
MAKHLAIVPAYNEAGAVAATVREIREHAPGFDVLVIDDGSTDATAAKARAAGAAVISHPFNLGIGGAVQSGYQFAFDQGYTYAVQVDGDGQHDPRNIPMLVETLAATPDRNMVTGSRFLVASADGFKSTLPRRLGIRLYARVLSWIVGERVTDPTSGFRLIDRKGIELFARDYPHDYPEVEAVLLLHFHRLRSREVPVLMRQRTTGVSSINASRSIYYMVKVTLAILVGLLRARPVIEEGEPAAVTAEHAL